MKNSILIEGHTDSKPYQGMQYSNWELSADRANSARKIMQENGLRHDQVTQVRGFADQQLRIPDKPEDPSNRRVSIIVQYPDNSDPDPTPAEAAKDEGAPKPTDGHGAVAAKPAGAHGDPAHSESGITSQGKSATKSENKK